MLGHELQVLLAPRGRLGFGNVIRQRHRGAEAANSLGFLVPQDGPEFFRELTRVGTQLLTNRADVNDLVGEQFFQQWFDQRPVAGNQREASMQLRALLVDRCGIGGKPRRQKGRGNLGIRIEFFDNDWQLIRFRTHQASDEPFDAGCFLLSGFLREQLAPVSVDAIPGPQAQRR